MPSELKLPPPVMVVLGTGPLYDGAAMLRAVADRAAQMSQECNPNVPAGFPLIDLMNELRAAADRLTSATR